MEKERLKLKNAELAKIFGVIDKESLVILKGHLLIEESLNFIIENFVHHSDFMNKAKLTFYQKLNIARSMSVSEQENSMWLLIEKINTLRNDFAHRLESDKRESKIQVILSLYKTEMKSTDFEDDWENEDLPTFLAFVISLCLGFLTALEAEIKRFKSIINIVDKSTNKK
ncbi:hypothetical protein HNQ02_003847 [Flavobacterium sp. 7E]|uniref:hypothetical protein n=1 Tax=Flavobacterium sp. 7E TaxID=2735898 RepID=UPI00156DEBBC|nr:hypothetical protein [Flavobacterium sp. 7E]NRS90896.1 hypothetical protein [Flavobacterium sp. 7E]